MSDKLKPTAQAVGEIADRAKWIADEFGAPMDSPETKAAHVAAILELAAPMPQGSGVTDEQILFHAERVGLAKLMNPIGLQTGKVAAIGSTYMTEEVLDFARAILALAPHQPQPEPTSKGDRSEAYDMIDRFLRNNLSDEDYAEYSQALDLIFHAAPLSPSTSAMLALQKCDALLTILADAPEVHRESVMCEVLEEVRSALASSQQREPQEAAELEKLKQCIYDAGYAIVYVPDGTFCNPARIILEDINEEKPNSPTYWVANRVKKLGCTYMEAQKEFLRRWPNQPQPKPQEASKPKCSTCGGRGYVMTGYAGCAGADECPDCAEPQEEASKVEAVADELYGYLYTGKPSSHHAGSFINPVKERLSAEYCRDIGLDETPVYLRPSQQALSDAKDAARYRWLRDVGDANWRPFGIRAGYSAKQADAAIDSAIQAAIGRMA